MVCLPRLRQAVLASGLVGSRQSGLVNFTLPQNNRNYCLPVATKWKTGKEMMSRHSKIDMFVLLELPIQFGAKFALTAKMLLFKKFRTQAGLDSGPQLEFLVFG